MYQPTRSMELNIDLNSNFEVTEMTKGIINSLKGEYNALRTKEYSKPNPDQEYMDDLLSSIFRIQDVEGQVIELSGDSANNGKIVELLRPLHRELLTMLDSQKKATV